MNIHKQIFRIGFWTGISRIFGFVRDMLVARVLGAGFASDVFFAAFKLPNMFRNWLGEGAMNVAFVPMFTDRKRDPNFASNAFSWLMAILLGITIVMQIIMPLVVWALAPGFAAATGKLSATIFISRIMFFYLIFICGSAMLSAILNAFSRFALVAAMPILLNILMIAALFVARGNVLIWLSGAVVLSGVLQMWILWRRLRAQNFGLQLVRPRLTPAMKTLFRRIGIGFFGTGFYQINVLLGTLIASFSAGAVSYLYFADRMIQLPFAMIGLAAGTVLLTSISDAICDNKMMDVYKQQNRALTQTLMLTFPCVAGLAALATPIIKYLFQYGAWTSDATAATAMAMAVLAFTLPAMTTSQIYEKTLYATQDVKTPVRLTAISLCVSSVIYVGLFPVIGFMAVPVGTLVGGYLRNLLYVRECRRRGLFRLLPSTTRKCAMFGVLAAVMGVGLWFAAPFITGIFTLAAAIGMAGILYLVCALFYDRIKS